jgi:hypothetical protein
MPQHVEMHRHWQPSALADDLDQPVDGIRRERRAALGGEDISLFPANLEAKSEDANLTHLQLIEA